MKFIYLFLFAGLLFSCKKSTKPEVAKKSFKNILILGNSITRHAPAAHIGWHGNWGMAASSEEKDYVHLLMGKFKSLNAEAKVTYLNLSGYEVGYWAYDLSAIDTIVSVKQDLIILRLAENVNQLHVSDNDFKKHYTKLIEYLKSRNPDAKVICTAGFWNNPPVEILI
ncbi:MAG TPA: SGNH/GDSL hydrolase family protein, partial [Sphingobacteriaceae bacterium]